MLSRREVSEKVEPVGRVCAKQKEVSEKVEPVGRVCAKQERGQ